MTMDELQALARRVRDASSDRDVEILAGVLDQLIDLIEMDPFRLAVNASVPAQTKRDRDVIVALTRLLRESAAYAASAPTAGT